LLPNNLAEKMGYKLEDNHLELVFASSKEDDGKIWSQPVFCLMRSDLQDSLSAFLSKGDLKIDRWFKELRSGTVVFENTQAFANVNTPEELAALEKASQ
jgi:molybdopterin-guanine dinucleotide biosynthesis protein A